MTANGHDIDIVNGRHPVVEKVMGSTEYIPNDVTMDADTDMLLITGPNMSGKSTYMRQLALIVIMAQAGGFIPADHATLPVFDKIFTRIGAADDLANGQSTFMVEMLEANAALSHATSRSLILFDEIGRGTATYDGMALAQAIIEYLHDHVHAKTLFSTHYHELTALADHLDRLRNVHVGATSSTRCWLDQRTNRTGFTWLSWPACPKSCYSAPTKCCNTSNSRAVRWKWAPVMMNKRP